MHEFPEPRHFRDESEALYRLLQGVEDAVFERETQFKRWSAGDILTHLHFWNGAVEQSLADAAGFAAFAARLRAELQRSSLRAMENAAVAPLRGRALLQAWRERCARVAERFAAADPKARLQWVGPGMSARSSISARLMETWAHAQAIYDLLGAERVDTDRVHSIAVLGVNTYGWTFRNRGEEPPAPRPDVRLTAPSGAQWRWGEPNEDHFVEGSAVEFCQVVAQTRNIADTRLSVRGEPAMRWMAQAQCFAGAPQAPPAPGTRFKARSPDRTR
ncbi:MAG TPA: TIGR03084 family metal-binding protein [Burkholderiales bacterium]|nr:TIGR03084 family metal-binding protein [Burkholderiales bacterium]